MPTYRITAPDGRTFNVTGEGSKEEALAQVQAKYRAPSKPEAPVDPSAGGGTLRPFGIETGIQTPQWLDRGLAGAGKAFVDTGRGLGQWAGLVDREDVARSRELDAPLMKTGMGKVGNLTGSLAMLAPTAAIPGANTVAGAGAIGALSGALQPSTSTGETARNIGLGGALGAGSQWAGQKIAQGVTNRLAAREAAAATAKTQNAVRDATLAEAQKAGYVVPPTTTNPTMTNRLIEGAAGKITTAQAASMKNQNVTNKLVRESLGVAEDAPLTRETLRTIRSEAGKVYQAVKDSGEIITDNAFIGELDDLLKKSKEISAAFPDANVASATEITQLAQSLKQDRFPASAALEYLKELRSQASSNLSFQAAADPAKKALGLAQSDAAGALEDQIIRHLKWTKRGDIADQFDKARTLIAKTYSVQSALNESTGNVVASALGNQLKRNKPLSGGLELAAKFSRIFPKASKEVTESMPGISPIDMYGSLIASGATGNPAPMLYPLVRMAARGGQFTGFGQRMAVPNYAPGAAGTLALKGMRGLGQAATPLALSAQAMQ